MAAERLAIATSFDGIGYVFSADDPYCGIDLDGCRNPDTGHVESWAQTWIDRFATYTEVSPSGTGVKLWCRGKNPRGEGGNVKIDAPRVTAKEPGVEISDTGRFFTTTGWHVNGTPATVRTPADPNALEALVAAYFPKTSTREPQGRFAFTKLITFEDLLVLDTSAEYLIEDVLVRGQHGVVGGRSKTLKTSAIIDMCLSLGSGTPFLNKWPTRKCNVAFWSGESGAATIKAKAAAAAKAKGVNAASVYWSFDLPKLCRKDHLMAMAEVIRQRGIDVAIVDPLYLTLLDARTASQASNVFAMGPALAPLSAMGQETGCTILVAHHFRKTGTSDPDEPASLDQLSQAGVGEWVRQWVLLERRSPYQADGHHALWLRTGGSAGHAGLWALDVDEGVRTVECQANWRRWDVQVRQATEVDAEVKRNTEKRKVEKQAERDADDCRRMLNALQSHPPETLKALREVAGLDNKRGGKAICRLVSEGRAEQVEIKKHTRMETGYRYIAR
jgi:replicative DNA helicase